MKIKNSHLNDILTIWNDKTFKVWDSRSAEIACNDNTWFLNINIKDICESI